MTPLYRLTRLDRRLWALAWPLMLTNLTVPMLGLVDTAVLGHLPDPQYLGAVAVGANLFSILYWTFGFMRMGTTGLAAQAWGKRDEHGQVALLVRSLLLAVAIGLVLITFQQPLIHTGLALMNPSAGVLELASEYAAIRIWSAPAVLCQYTLVGWLIGTQYSRGPMIMLVVANGVNLVLDVLFVTGFGWNSRGVAMATVIAEYSAALIGLAIVLRRMPEGQRMTRALIGTLADYRRILQVNRFIMVRTIALLLAFAFFTAQGARQGDAILAANAVLFTFLLVISNALDGFANAAEALIGEAVGRGNRRQFKRVFDTALRWSIWGALLLTALFVLGGQALIGLLTNIEAVQINAWQYLPWVWLLPFTAVWGFLFDGVFIGATQTRAMQNTMLFAALGVYLPVWWLTTGWGNHGLWFAMISLMLARALSMGLVYLHFNRQGRWFRSNEGP
ncbi:MULTISPECIES: MATE family efflux transporter [unclassified Marinobacter]|uniref:MATE family efflux transporter n=1 Tax=unclassified Marinobacter TaxID=83889 RepID=UPI00200E9838|nr:MULTISPECIES: MATE family efflux transporter [unclassified Marinobacter]MCL1476609.1 MATE family efflux transporter [Marinobacter sp.]MCL1481203.1 MATE family efflux transporter [Marinobacter sp.]MCL1484677.1 MATE family efflux transporter [Marinobacter sp.]MCL1487932.1 MATE family efflux transporter [Marinobacter sp.]UQG56159.1 MATE family efflux transporter [Marinobacter sp. M4C]